MITGKKSRNQQEEQKKNQKKLEYKKTWLSNT